MLRVLPVVNEKCCNHEQVANDAQRSAPKDECLDGLVLFVGIHRILALASTALDIY